MEEKSSKSLNNLHKTFSKMLMLAQIFGYFPVQGILGPDYQSLKFSWKSFRVWYSLLTIASTVFVSLIQFHKIVTKGLDIMEANRICFELYGIFSGILFLKLAKNWVHLMKDWSEVEQSLNSYGWPSGLNKKLHTILVTFMVMALGEYLLGQSNKLYLSIECNKNTADSLTYFLGKMSFAHFFSILEYDVFKGFILQLINFQLCFIWTFNDSFVMILSTALAYRFKQITTKIWAVTEAKTENRMVWQNLREDYNRLCRFCRLIDKEIANIVLVTFASDLFFILVQLFNSLRHLRNNLERFYFYYSFGLLIVRTISLCLFGAKVNDESKKPLLILNSVPSNVYNTEIQRFIQQIGTCHVALTGKQFFYITRGLILSIAGAIVTYELVLIQFNDSVINKTSEADDEKCAVFD